MLTAYETSLQNLLQLPGVPTTLYPTVNLDSWIKYRPLGGACWRGRVHPLDRHDLDCHRAAQLQFFSPEFWLISDDRHSGCDQCTSHQLQRRHRNAVDPAARVGIFRPLSYEQSGAG